MQSWIIEIMNSFGYIGVMFLIAIENIFPPIPSEVILTFGGFMTTYTNMNVWILALFATIGSVLGAIVLYAVGRLFNADRLDAWIEKWGKILRLKKGDVHKAEKWFTHKGKKTVFFCRFIPIVRSLISIPAGMAKMKSGIFLAYTTIGTAIWNVVLIWLGKIAGSEWEKIAGYMDIYSVIGLFVILIICLLLGFVAVKKLKKRSAESQGENL